MRPFAICIVALAWSAGASLAHAQVDFEHLIDSLTGLNGPGEVDAPVEESPELKLESVAPSPSDATEERDLDELERAEDATREADESAAAPGAPKAAPSTPPHLQQGDNRIPDRVDLRALVEEQPDCGPADRMPPPSEDAAAWAVAQPPAGPYATGPYAAGPYATGPYATEPTIFPADPIASYRTPPCYRGLWDGYAAERAARCYAHHKCLHGVCDCFTPGCAAPLAPR